MLTRLAQIGMALAEDAGRSAAAVEADDTPAQQAQRRADATLVYTRAARAVRMSIALQSRLLKDLDDLDKADSSDRSVEVIKRRTRVRDLVERAVEAEAQGGDRDEDEIETLRLEADERLDDEHDYGDLMDGPLGAVVARIARDLGLEPDWDAMGVGRWFGDGGEEAGPDATERVSASPNPIRHPRVEQSGSPRTQPPDPFNCRVPAAPPERLGPRDYGPSDLRPRMTDESVGSSSG